MGCKPLRGTQLSISSCLALGVKSGGGRERRSLFLPAGSFPSGHGRLVNTSQLSSTLPNSCGTLGLRCSFQPEREDAPASVQAPCSWTGLPPEGAWERTTFLKSYQDPGTQQDPGLESTAEHKTRTWPELPILHRPPVPFAVLPGGREEGPQPECRPSPEGPQGHAGKKETDSLTNTGFIS